MSTYPADVRFLVKSSWSAYILVRVTAATAIKVDCTYRVNNLARGISFVNISATFLAPRIVLLVKKNVKTGITARSC